MLKKQQWHDSNRVQNLYFLLITRGCTITLQYSPYKALTTPTNCNFLEIFEEVVKPSLKIIHLKKNMENILIQ